MRVMFKITDKIICKLGFILKSKIVYNYVYSINNITDLLSQKYHVLVYTFCSLAIILHVDLKYSYTLNNSAFSNSIENRLKKTE